MRRVLLFTIAVVVVARPLNAQIAVYDPANTARNSISATIKEYLLETQREQHAKIRRMARRLSVFADLRRFAVADTPRWRTHGGDFLYANGINDALIFGDPSGAAYLAVSHPVVRARALLGRLTAAAQRAMTSRLATIELADAVEMSAINDAGSLRLNGRKQELPAIDALEAQVIDPSDAQSATAVLDKISGAVLIGARQRQARSQLLAAFVEQLLVDSKRDRDADAAAMNMQLVTWRDRRAANEAFVAGTGDALRTWRQPQDERRRRHATQPLTHGAAGDHQPADRLRTGVSAVRLRPVPLVRDHPDRVAGDPNDVLTRRSWRSDVRVRQAPHADLFRLRDDHLLRGADSGIRRLVQQSDHRSGGLLPERAGGEGVRQHLPALRRTRRPLHAARCLVNPRKLDLLDGPAAGSAREGAIAGSDRFRSDRQCCVRPSWANLRAVFRGAETRVALLGLAEILHSVLVHPGCGDRVSDDLRAVRLPLRD